MSIIIFLAAALIIAAVIASLSDKGTTYTESPQKRAGNIAERHAADIIRSVMRNGDILLTNVNICLEGKEAELDNVIINNYGVFIIEVKHYSGWLEGREEDSEWTKYHMSRGKIIYVKSVKNPIRQVKRQAYILSEYLKLYGINVWIKGYAIIFGSQYNIKSDFLLSNVPDVNRVIHTPGRKPLNDNTVYAIASALKRRI